MHIGTSAWVFLLGLFLAPIPSASAQSVGLLREVWEGIDGTALDALTSSPDYPGNPTSRNYVTDLFEAPIDVLESYGQRMHGYLVPPLTGDYTFWIATDDQGALYLGTDENPATARLVARVDGWTSPREWERESAQRSSPIRLTAGKAYYVSALMKEGGGGDNLAVRWLMPNGVDQGPIVATNLLPFGVSFTAPVIARQPESTTAVEGSFARFSVGLSTVGPAQFTWRRNGAPIAGSNDAELVVGPVRLADHGSKFGVVVSNAIGSVLSSEATLGVTPDVTPPTIDAILNIGTRVLRVTFSEALQPASATNLAHYSLGPGISLASARLGSSPHIVELDTSPLVFGNAYTLSVHDVADQARTPNAIAPGTQVPFVAVEYAPVGIGTLPIAGSVRSAPGGATVVASGEIGNRADAFQFAYQIVSGNFDRRVRVASFGPSDPFAAAGLMARASLEPSSPFAAALTTPGIVGSFLLSRSTAAGAAQRAGSFPANYPQTWLRLARTGSTFRAYAGYDGVTWTELASINLTLPSTVFLGFAGSSRDPLRTTTVEFRDAGAVTGSPTVNSLRPDRETPGPSSRLTPLVLSEIHYHPRERADRRSAEFVEFHNADLVDQDLGGHRLSGSVEFAFPDGYVLPAGGFAVVARNPSDLAVIHGLADALGPFDGTNGLANGQGTLRLLNPQGAVLLEVVYDSRAPWPVAADGAGHSLVLSRPSFGEADPRAWSAGETLDGSPGTFDVVRPNPFASVVFNEILAHTDPPQLDALELYNHGNEPVNLGGCFLTDDPATNRFRIPDGTRITPRGFLAFDESQLGFRLDAAGEALFLVRPDASGVIDAVRFGPQENGVSSGRYPDGTPEWRRLTAPTPGAENAPFRVGSVVINEIHYHPISDDDDDEFVELFNRGAAPVSLGRWSFTDGIDYRFPSNAVLGAGEYVVVAKNRARLLTNYPGLSSANVYGDYGGTLSNGGERLALAMPDSIVVTNELGLVETRRIDIDVAEVTYGTGGRWGSWSDGLGSSLELVDPYSDALQASAWADSDETGKAPWTLVEFTGRVDNAADSTSANRLHLLAQGPGEYLVDDIQVLAADGANRVVNGDFASGRTGWTPQGNHRRSALAEGAGPDGSGALRILATGRGDTAVNRVRGNLNPALSLNATVTLRARVRWLRGWPEFLIRTLGNGIEAHGRLSVPAGLGTPGARNSRAVANAGPTIFDVTHSPVVPRANESIVVTARVTDPDGVDTVSLRYRVDPATALTTVVMRDDGSNGDAVAGDGTYSARLPGRAAGNQIAFTVNATDRDATPAGSVFPRPTTFPAPATPEALVRWGETKPFGNLGVYRFWQRQRDYDALRSREPLANDPLDCTFVYGDERVIYNAEMRGKGSPWHGGSIGGDYVFSMPDDDRLLGARDLAIVTLGNLGSDPSAQREQAAFWIGRQMGVATLHRRHVHFFENGGFKGLYEDTEEPNGLYADRWFPDGQDGDLFKIEDWFEFNDGGDSFVFARDATLERFTTLGGGLKQARYRWAWRKRAVARSANDYQAFLQLVDTVANPTTSTAPRIEGLVDIDNWMRTFALQHIVGNWDAYGHSRGKNSYLYLPTGGRWKVIPWDIDFVLGSSSDGPTADVFGSVDPVVSRLWNVPVFRRAYWRAFQDAVEGPLDPRNIDAILDARYAALVANGFEVESPAAIKSFVRQRRAYLTSRIASEDTPSLEITSNNGADFSTANPSVTLTGRAPVAVATLLVNGVPYPVTWPSVSTWSLTLALGAPTNRLDVTGLDSRGRPIPGAKDSVTVRYSGPPIAPADFVVIHEIMFDPAVPDTAFLEIHNTSSTGAFDLSGWRLDGVGFTFPPGSLIAPGAYVVVAANLAAFRAAYGTTVVPIAEFPGNLRNDGERLRLLRPGPAPNSEELIDEVEYGATPPWPTSAAGAGSSLQLIDPRLDNRRPANWAATPTHAPPLATPGRPNSVATTLEPFPDVWINEIQPRNTSGPADSAGDRDPWIELHNSGDTPVNLADLVLSANPSQLNGWAFPPGTTLAPHRFLVVWCDGETAESSTSEVHTPFRIHPTNGVVTLARIQLGAAVAIHSVAYRDVPPDRSYGLFPDANPLERNLFHRPTPGTANTLATSPLQVVINEWMASNTGAVTDPADGDDDDWFELHNAGDTPADLSGFTLTDSLANPAQFRIPTGTMVPPGGFLLVWADEEPSQTVPGQLHVNFKLSGGGETLALLAPDGSTVESLVFGAQTNNVSQGRYPDAEPAPFVFLDVPTPGEPNAMSSANPPPSLSQLTDLTADEGTPITFSASAIDPDPSQTLTFSLLTAPAGATIDPASGLFRWTPSEADGPGVYRFSIRVTDDGRPPRSDSEPITVTVAEVNQPPILTTPTSARVDEGNTLTFTAAATDPDLPSQTLTFELPQPNQPEGARIDPVTGVFTWTPTEDQGPDTYQVFVGVYDDREPRQYHGRFVIIAVHEVDNPPVFEPVGLQSVDELTPFSLTLVARDPDRSPKAIVYAVESAPSGVTVDAVSGDLRWTPSEDAGPGSYPITVRATESGTNRFSLLTFSVAVAEKNEPPSLDAIPDFDVPEGSTVDFAARASDTDRPTQRLTFRLDPGAPAEASVDPQSGIFSWTVGPDAGASTNRITLVVSDNSIDSRSTSRTFTVWVRPVPRLRITEIQYAAALPGTEFVELFNPSRNTAWPLDGWRLTGLDFTFPAATLLAPTQHLVVARNTKALAAAYGQSTPAIGDATLAFGTHGPQFVRLQRPTTNPAWETIDEVSFLRESPWPTNANGRGPSLQLVDLEQDNRRLANWASVLGTSTNAPVTVVTFTNVWSYKQDAAPPTNWRERAFSDTSWPGGRGLLYVEDAALPAPKSTALTRTEGRMTYYFRTRFPFQGNPDGASLVLATVLDDGAIVYLNGSEIYRLGMDATPATDDTPSNRTVADATLEGPFTIPVTNLVAGENVVAVEVHQVNTTSSDIVWGARIDVLEVRRESATPGYANSVRATLPPFPDVWLHEVLPLNTTGIADGAGDRDPWIEIAHRGTNSVDLAGWWLTDRPDELTRWAFPAPALLAPESFRILWADAEPTEHTPDSWHVSFRLPSPNGFLALVRLQNGVPAIVDYLAYEGAVPNQSFGIPFPDQPLIRGPLPSPTPGNENVANHPPTLASVAPIQSVESVPLVFQLVAEDPDLEQTLAFTLAGNVPAGAAVNRETGHFTWTPTPAQRGDHAFEATVTDSGFPPLQARTPIRVTVQAGPTETLRITGIELLAPLRLRLAWTSRTGQSYRVESRASLNSPWAVVPGTIVATGPTASTEIPLEAGSQGYYRVALDGPP